MKVGIYYGGRGVIEDPTLYVLEVMEQVLDELNVAVSRYNLYEYRNNELTRLPSSIRDADAIILATTVEWLGIGGYMTQFLDALWLYGNRDKMASLYMQPVVLSTTYGEREGMLTLENAWESLGGIPANGLCGYVDDVVAFRQDSDYRSYIEKKTEDLYRTITQHLRGLPTSSQAVTQSVQRTRQMQLTPQESEQLSELAADESKVRQQKEDVLELSEMFKQMLGGGSPASSEPSEEYVADFEHSFSGQPEIIASFLFRISGKELPLLVTVNGREMSCRYEAAGDADVVCTLSPDIMETIVAGRMTFQRAFSVGDMSVKGSFATLRQLDELFPFAE